MTEIRKMTPSDAGCLIDGHYGWHGHAMMIDLAVDHGMQLSEKDQIDLDRYRNSDDPEDHWDSADHVLNQGGLLDQAESWLNDHVAPEDHVFHWHDGEFFLSQVSDLEELI